ncbi:hypothetical protein [Roseateles asaccharophilus]|uniref:Uncharacterized protein n=1 Tax=Roseateles asaccharophilus TaxID=582607 RepID=A0ABU2AB20_9BURK|nr:hypothetical protein [Roseateles asaccharophilus]MDR7334401.1 hypothetical protein [Roseateles asaccharophilus]
MGASDLRVTVDGVKLRCVLDPALVLGQACGLKLALGLTRVFETWLPRSFWQVLDASELLAAESQSGLHPLALNDWTALRDGTDAGSWTLRWVGDNLAESQLRGSGGGDESLVERFEWHAEALQAHQAQRAEHWCRGFDPVAGAHDALALSAALDGALILCRAPDEHSPPGPIQALGRLDSPPRLLAESDGGSLLAAERLFVRQAIAAAGLAALLQSVQHACVVHALTLPPDADASNDDSQDPWRCSQAWWYRL